MLLECAARDGRFEVQSGELEGAWTEAAAHCSGAASAVDQRRRAVDVSVCGRSCAHAASVGVLYDGFDAVGLQYGPRFRTLVRAWGGVAAPVARLEARSTHEGMPVRVADLDDALCVGSLASGGRDSGETRLPFAVDDALLQGTAGHLSAVRVRPR